MSRGPGHLQRALFRAIRRHGKPMTFADIRAAASQSSGYDLFVAFERSLRRSLQKMVAQGAIITIGSGGPSDPFRYFLHPMLIAMSIRDKTEARALMDTLNEAMDAKTEARVWGEIMRALADKGDGGL